jgi:DNA-binding MarR family transcriptional regulator
MVDMAGSGPAERAAQETLKLLPQLYRWAQTQTLHAEGHDHLSFRQLSALAVIQEESPTLGEVARRLMVTPAVITGLIDRLVRQGYVERVNRPGDRRRIYLELTDAGREVAVKAQERLTQDLAEHLRDLSPQDLNAIDEAMMALNHVFSAAEGMRERQTA